MPIYYTRHVKDGAAPTGWRAVTEVLYAVTCSRCRTFKPVEGFASHTGKPKGLQSWCRACFAAYSVERRQHIYARARERQWLKAHWPASDAAPAPKPNALRLPKGTSKDYYDVTR